MGLSRAMSDEQKAYTRLQESWLANRERFLLIKIAGILPRWVKPDHMTLLGVGGAALCGAGFVLSTQSACFLWLSAIGLVLNWAGDSLDGNLARLRGTERPVYGFFVDHTCDIVSQALVFLGIAASPYARFETGCLLLMSYWLAAMFTFIRTISMQVFQISYFGVGPTEIRIALLVYVFSLLTVGRLPIGRFSLLDILAIGIFATVMISFVCMTILQARRLDGRDTSRKSNMPEPLALQPVMALALANKTSA